MTTRLLRSGCVRVALSTALAVACSAQDRRERQAPQDPPAPRAAAAAQDKPQEPGVQPMDPEMAAWIKAGTPNENHQRLEYMIGTWDTTVKTYQAGVDEPMVSKGTTVNQWIMGGRYVRTEFHGTFMEQPFEGIGVTGYDNLRKHYVTGWIDCMSTGIAVEKGTYDEASRTFTYLGECPTPSAGTLKTRSLIRVEGPNRHVLSVYHGEAGKDMVRVMEITYERSGGAPAERPK